MFLTDVRIFGNPISSKNTFGFSFFSSGMTNSDVLAVPAGPAGAAAPEFMLMVLATSFIEDDADVLQQTECALGLE